MGRFYRTTEGREGKFALGSQPSTDPGVFFEMEECPWYGYARETICGSFVGVDE